MATTLPRGILAIKWKNQDGSTSIRYKVRIVRKDFKANKNFESLDEAKEFLALSKAKRGKEIIYSITQKEQEQRETVIDSNNYTLEYFVKLYIEKYITSDEAITELEIRNRNNKLSFLRTIVDTSVLDRTLTHEEKEEMGIDALTDKNIYRKFGNFDVRTIKSTDINNYVLSRKKFIKPISIAREITYISNVFKKLYHLNDKLGDIQNPTRLYDKDLLGRNQVTKREKIVSEDEEIKLFKILENKANKELFKIAKVSLLTGMRRSEVCTLDPAQIKDTYIQLTIATKSRKARKVYLTKEAKDYLASIKPFRKDKFFKYTIGGFDRMWHEVVNRKGELPNVHFHDLRRTNISRLLSKIGHDNTILATEILGLTNIKKFEELHANEAPQEPKTQFQAMKSWGHSSAQVTKGYFNIVFKPVVIKQS